jgi:hypothetical protein
MQICVLARGGFSGVLQEFFGSFDEIKNGHPKKK